MLVYMCSEWLFELIREVLVVCSVFQVLNHCLFDVCEGEKFFHAHGSFSFLLFFYFTVLDSVAIVFCWKRKFFKILFRPDRT